MRGARPGRGAVPGSRSAPSGGFGLSTGEPGGPRAGGEVAFANLSNPNEAAADLRFEYAARLRDEVNELKRELREAGV